MASIDKKQAYDLAKKIGYNFKDGFYVENTSSRSAELAALAKLAGYRKSKTAKGSTARCFYDHLQRLKKKNKWR